MNDKDFMPSLKLFKVARNNLEKKNPLEFTLKEEFFAKDVRIGIHGPCFLDLKYHSIELELSDLTNWWIRTFDKGIKLAPCVMFLAFVDWGKGNIYQKHEMSTNSKIDWLKVQQIEEVLNK